MNLIEICLVANQVGLKEIRPSGLGWDGTYIGQPMPANDYWFTVEYAEQNIKNLNPISH